MLDLVRLTIRAGKGGDGKVSFHRAKYVPKGGPDGGDGGDGGSIYLRGNKNLNTLQDFAGHTVLEAENGQVGGKDKSFGKKGEDLYIDVPIGTVVWEMQSEVSDSKKKVQANLKQDEVDDIEEVFISRQKELKDIRLKDIQKTKVVEILADGQEELVAKGGHGGKGNDRFKSSTNTTPMYAQKGTPGKSLEVYFELKLLADVGLVGFPNAGKSTFLSLVTRANPKIANYPFTTLSPNLGVLSLYGKEVVIADIPGLIEGASEGKGLGIQFLRHVERCRVLLYVLFVQDLDASVADQAQQIFDDYHKLLDELKNYNPDLVNLPSLISINKIDLYSPDLQKKVEAKFKKEKKNLVFWSGATQQGIEQVKQGLEQILST